MAEAIFDAARFKAREKKGWDEAAADWAGQLGTLTADLADKLVRFAGVRPGDQVLDVATGSGVVALAARRRVGMAGRVVGCDIAANLLDIARAQAGGYSNVSFIEADAEELPSHLPPSAFRVALSQLGLMYVPDKLAMLKGMHHTLVAGGVIAVAVWAEASRCELAGTAAVVAPWAGPPRPGTPGLWDMGDPALHEQLFTAAGFSKIGYQFVRHDWHFANAEAASDAMFNGTGTLRPFYYKQPLEVQAAMRAAMVQFFNQHPADDGGVVLKNEVLLVRAICA